MGAFKHGLMLNQTHQYIFTHPRPPIQSTSQGDGASHTQPSRDPADPTAEQSRDRVIRRPPLHGWVGSIPGVWGRRRRRRRPPSAVCSETNEVDPDGLAPLPPAPRRGRRSAPPLPFQPLVPLCRAEQRLRRSQRLLRRDLRILSPSPSLSTLRRPHHLSRHSLRPPSLYPPMLSPLSPLSDRAR